MLTTDTNIISCTIIFPFSAHCANVTMPFCVGKKPKNNDFVVTTSNKLPDYPIGKKYPKISEPLIKYHPTKQVIDPI